MIKINNQRGCKWHFGLYKLVVKERALTISLTNDYSSKLKTYLLGTLLQIFYSRLPVFVDFVAIAFNTELSKNGDK